MSSRIATDARGSLEAFALARGEILAIEAGVIVARAHLRPTEMVLP